MKKTIKPTPEPTLRRMPRYLHLLNRLLESGTVVVSSTVIANELHLDATQVRKDIEHTNIVGRPKTGYDVANLIVAIEQFLNWNISNDAFLAGAGSLGTAMLGYGRFKKYGLNFLAAFDTDQNKIGKKIHDVPVFNIEKITEMAKEMKINLGVLTVPAPNAQSTADLMIDGGIKGIWNFAPTQIKVPQGVIVENAQLSQSLAVLSHKLARK